MTKQELRDKLLSGQIFDELFHFTHGQECLIFKADKFCTGDEIIYIPDIDLNEIPVDTNLSVDNSMMDELNRGWGPMTAEEQINFALSFCYTGNDFVDECGGDVEKAKRLFWYCDWQHPYSAVDEIDDEEDVVVLLQPARTRELLQATVDWMVGQMHKRTAIVTLLDIGFTADELVELSLGSDNVLEVLAGYEPSNQFA